LGNLGIPELLVIAVLALIVFGPERLPELARQAGKALARFRSETSKSMDELKRAADLQDLDRELRALGRDVRDVRSSVSRALTDDPSTARRAQDAPPPVDPEAT
jgi:sec-independent protein translocase protein TatB